MNKDFPISTHYKIHTWTHELEPGHIMTVQYDEGCATEPVRITIRSVDEAISLYGDEVQPLVDMLMKLMAVIGEKK